MLEKVEKFNSGIHFGCEAFLKKGIRLSTVIALTDSVVFALDPKRVAEVASINGEFLALLNEKMVLGQQRIISTKWKMQKRETIPSVTTPHEKRNGENFTNFLQRLIPFSQPVC